MSTFAWILLVLRRPYSRPFLPAAIVVAWMEKFAFALLHGPASRRWRSSCGGYHTHHDPAPKRRWFRSPLTVFVVVLCWWHDTGAREIYRFRERLAQSTQLLGRFASLETL